jgi:hypothetical protein
MWSDLSTQGPYSALLRVGLAIPSLLPGPWWALTPPFHPHRGFVSDLIARHHGRLFSVALSLGLPPPGVTRHPSFMESGLSSKVCTPAVIQPSAQGADKRKATGPLAGGGASGGGISGQDEKAVRQESRLRWRQRSGGLGRFRGRSPMGGTFGERRQGAGRQEPLGSRWL